MELLFGLMWLLVVHFVADFVLQSDRVAKGKSSSEMVLLEHVAIYTAVLALGAAPLFWALGVGVSGWLFFLAVNAWAHGVTDHVTSRINARLWREQRVHAFFVGIGADQLVHGLTLGGTLALAVRQ